MSGGIKCWPEAERPREKLMHKGVSALCEAGQLMGIKVLDHIIGDGEFYSFADHGQL